MQKIDANFHLEELQTLYVQDRQAGFAQILLYLGHENWNIRKATAQIIGRLGLEASEMLMQEIIKTKNAETRQNLCFFAESLLWNQKPSLKHVALVFDMGDNHIKRRVLERIPPLEMDQDCKEFLFSALGHESWDVRDRAYQAICKFGPEVLPWLEIKFAPANNHQKFWTFKIFARLLGAESIRHFSNFVKTDPKSEQLQVYAVSNLAEIDEPKVLRTLLNFAKADSFLIVDEVLRSLKKLAKSQKEEFINILSQPLDVRTLELMLRVAAESFDGSIVEELRFLFTSNDYPTRFLSVSYLGNLKHQKTAQELISVFKDEKWGLRKLAMEKAAALGSFSVQALIQVLEEGEETKTFWALKSLRLIAEPTTLPFIAGCLNHPSKEIRLQALDVIASINQEDCAELLIEAFDNSMWEVRQKSSELLTKISHQPFINLLGGCLSPSENIRFWSQRTLEMMNLKGAPAFLEQLKSSDANPLHEIRRLKLADKEVLLKQLQRSVPDLFQIQLTIQDQLQSSPASHQIIIQNQQEDIYRVKIPEAGGEVYPHELTTLFEHAVNLDASDIHLKLGQPPILRVKNKLITMRYPPLNNEHILNFIRHLLNPQLIQFLERNHQADASHETQKGQRLRLNIFKTRRGYEIAGRFITEKIPTFESLNLPSNIMQKLCEQENGLVILTGPTGSGKTSTLASMINYINLLHHKHIIAIEDPIEYIHHSRLCYISQREVLKDVPSYPLGIRATLREDPDIILVGELRDKESVETAMTLSGTGHLVLTTLHAPTTSNAVEQLMDFFSENQQDHIRKQIAFNLKAIISQRLLRHRNGKVQIPAIEILISTPAVKNVIRDGKTEQLPTIIETSKKEGMIALDQYLKMLIKEDKITMEEAWPHVVDQKTFSV